MSSLNWVNQIPLLAIFGLTVLYVFIAILGGVRLGLVMKKSEKGESSIGSIVGATLGLLAFLLAFTFNMAANRFDQRKQLLMDDVNAIATAYRRAGMLPQPYGTNARALLLEYLDLRVRAAQDPQKLMVIAARSEQIQNQLWAELEKMIAMERFSFSHSMFIQAVNQMFELQSKRLMLGLQYRVPAAIWFGLYLISAMAMIMVGYQSSSSSRNQYPIYLVLAIAFSAVIVMIADLDRAGEGIVKLSHQPFIELQQKISALP